MIGTIELNKYYGTYRADVDGYRATFRSVEAAEEWCYDHGALTVIVEE